MSAGPAANDTKRSCGSPPVRPAPQEEGQGRAGDSQPSRQQSDIADLEALVVEQDRKITPRNFSSPAPPTVDPLSEQTNLSPQNFPIPVVDNKGSAKLVLDNMEYKWLGEVNGERMGIFVSAAGKTVVRYPPKAGHVFTEDKLLRVYHFMK